MTGHLQIKRDKFYMVLDIYENGKRKQKWIATGLTVKGNKRRAEQMLREKLAEVEKQETAPHSAAQSDIELTVSECIRQWLAKVQRRVDEVTYQGYVLIANNQVLPYFDASGLLVQNCTVDALQAYFDEKAKNGRKDGKGGLSPASLRRLKNVLNQSLTEAVKAGFIASNPCQYVELPHVERYEASFYTVAQLQDLFALLENDPLCPLVKITALYGLRRSELLGLKWDSIDFENSRIVIRHTVVKVTNVIEKDKTKNQSSRRAFPMTDEAREIFLAAKAAEEENRRLLGKEYQENDYVFKWPDGHPFAPDYVSKHFAKMLKRCALPHIRFHELRHSCASLLLNNGFTLKDVQEWMGHSDIRMTANIYGHLDTARKQGMADKLTSCLKEI